MRPRGIRTTVDDEIDKPARHLFAVGEQALTRQKPGRVVGSP
jgi:hypothetical protein